MCLLKMQSWNLKFSNNYSIRLALWWTRYFLLMICENPNLIGRQSLNICSTKRMRLNWVSKLRLKKCKNLMNLRGAVMKFCNKSLTRLKRNAAQRKWSRIIKVRCRIWHRKLQNFKSFTLSRLLNYARQRSRVRSTKPPLRRINGALLKWPPNSTIWVTHITVLELNEKAFVKILLRWTLKEYPIIIWRVHLSNYNNQANFRLNKLQRWAAPVIWMFQQSMSNSR